MLYVHRAEGDRVTALDRSRPVAELIGAGVDRVEWHFFRSPVTGKVGLTDELRSSLDKLGINIVIHDD